MKALVCVLMAFLISNTHIAFAEASEASQHQMIPTVNIVEHFSRAESESKIRDMLSREDVQAQLLKYGLTKDEVSKRLATLSNSEIQQLTKQIDQARLGGDVGGILIVVALVLLIVFLIKRI